MASSRIPTPRGWRKTSRRCISTLRINKRKCFKCRSRYRPQRQWQKFCSRNCRWLASDARKSSLREKVKRVGSVENPFGVFNCLTCKKKFKSTRSTKKYCSHKCYRRRMSSNWMNKNRSKGLCYSCSSPPVAGTASWCEKHWLIQLSWRSGLRGRGSGGRLKALLVGQRYRCPYTGRKLVIGKNASIDHINPRSKFPGLIGKITNLEWVDQDVNRAKRAMSRAEFISICREVARMADLGLC